jgi:hypothetical protein
MGKVKPVPTIYIFGFAALTAACAAIVALAFLGVRMMHVTFATFALTAVIAWGALLLGVGGAWLLARTAQGDRTPASRTHETRS